MALPHSQASELLRPKVYATRGTAKRVLDVFVAIAGVAFFGPLMAFVAAAICLESGRPIFFAQIRLGQGGRHFRLYKFRKFYDKGTAAGRPLTLKDDWRLTRVGKFLVRTKLDELPQLWNVLAGDMSIVGPRPETLSFAECFKERYRRVLDYKPGIFGPNQVFFRNEDCLYQGRDPERFYRDVLFPLKARVDLAYFPRMNMFADIGWIIGGTLAVFGWSPFPRGGLDLIEEVEDWLRRSGGAEGILKGASESATQIPSWAQWASISAWAPSSSRSSDNKDLPVVCVQGLGFVGAAMAIAVASARDGADRPVYNVIGVDLQTLEGLSRIAALNRGSFPFRTIDAKLEQKARQAHAAGNLVATIDPAAFGAATIIIVDVPLDVLWHQGKPQLHLQPFRSAIRSIGKHMRPDALVIIETTVPPGTTAHIVAPVLQDEWSKRNLPREELLLAHSYERVTPGAAYFDSVVKMPRVYAGYNDRSAQVCEAFLRTVIDVEHYPLVRVSNTTASELGKVLENTFRAVTIALMEEWGSFAERIGVDLFEVVNSIRIRPTHSNIRTPGFGVGGYCLTKDPLMGQLAAQEIFRFVHPFPFASMAVDTNRDMPKRSLKNIKRLLRGSLAGRRLLLLGVSYREDVEDTRHSPSEVFYQAAKEEGAEVFVHDPLVDYWREQDLHVPKEMPHASGLDVVVLAVPHKEYKNFDYERWLDGHRPLFFDAFNVLDADQRNRLRALGCPVEGIGRG